MHIGFIDVLLILVVVAGPTKALAYFATHAGAMTLPERRAAIVKAIGTATVILLVFALLGQQIIRFFHVSVPALEIAGGAILFVFALQIVLGEGGHDDTKTRSADIAIYPIAMPLIASPQAIVAIVVVLARVQDLADRMVVVAAVLATMALNLALFWGFASAIGTGLSRRSALVSEVVLRVVAIMLAGLAVHLIIIALGDLGALPPSDPL